MKVYVSELPEDCKVCPYKSIARCVFLDQNVFDYMCYETSLKDCPLQDIADYTKQVRKEVCEDIMAEFDTSSFNNIDEKLYPPTQEAILIGKGFKACKERLFKKIDQIQGE